MQINLEQAAQRLREADDILILAHRRPDGDTLGSSFGLLFALEQLGKTARVECADPVPNSYAYFFPTGSYEPAPFTPKFIVAVDIATIDLLGTLGPVYDGKIDLCIDHHVSNSFYAKETFLDTDSPAAAQIVYEVIRELGATVDSLIANPLFTGLTTDTGCFRYASVTPKTHRVGAELMERGAEHAMINRLMFETKSRGLLEVERLVLESIQYYFDGLCATVFIAEQWAKDYGTTDDDLAGIATLPCTIEGVLAGITIREEGNGAFRISLRTQSTVDASKICATFGGGGHMNAAGCTIVGDETSAKEKITQAVRAELERNNLWTASS